MNSCKVVQAQYKAKKLTWLTYCGGGAGFVQLQCAKKCLNEVQELNSLVVSAVSEVLKQNKRAKDTAAHDSGLEDDPNNFNIKTLNIKE